MVMKKEMTVLSELKFIFLSQQIAIQYFLCSYSIFSGACDNFSPLKNTNFR